MKLMTLALVSLFAASAHAQSNYEKIKALYDAAKSPASIQAVIAKIPAIKACAKFNIKSESSTEKLVLVEHTVPSVGPEIPAVEYKGIGFAYANDRPALFFPSYKQTLNSQGLAISYGYSYQYSECWGEGVDRECNTITDRVSGAGVIRVSDKYILFMRDSDYGYCWF